MKNTYTIHGTYDDQGREKRIITMNDSTEALAVKASYYDYLAADVDDSV